MGGGAGTSKLIQVEDYHWSSSTFLCITKHKPSPLKPKSKMIFELKIVVVSRT